MFIAFTITDYILVVIRYTCQVSIIFVLTTLPDKLTNEVIVTQHLVTYLPQLCNFIIINTYENHTIRG
jgi:hypothetical protein